MKRMIALGFVLLVMTFTVSAQAGNPFIIEESGSFVSKVIDAKADLVITNGKGQLFAQTSTQSVIEWGPFLEICNTVGVGSKLVSGNSVIRTVKGLLFAEFTGGNNCVNLSSDGPLTVLSADITLEGNVTGGTGFYEGATGPILVTGIVFPVLVTPALDVKFGGVELKAEVTWNGN